MSYIILYLMSFVQAATEFLPVSSSGHLLFIKGLFHFEDMPIAFDIIVHFGSLIAILIFYRKKLIDLVKDSYTEIVKSDNGRPSLKFVIYILVSTFITGLVYVILGDSLDKEFHNPSILKFTYIFTTIILITTFFKTKKTVDVIKAGLYLPLLVGLFQGIALFPGVSRSGSTIAILLLLGVSSEQAAFYSFTLAIPAILGGVLIDAMDSANLLFFSENLAPMLLSLIISAIFSYFFLKILNSFLRKGHFWYFSIYTLLLSIASFIIFR
ncbi:undecaprenyl-diphosphate phosphatase [bacterium]|nr:undecaprenyl-diphosphate phosphatase [bacterium]